ncbi:MAG: glutamine amidotransferase [Desulfobacterota bacterium]|nr:glutamine amidotransferase [Thermodesulfobacteriota bacterium]
MSPRAIFADPLLPVWIIPLLLLLGGGCVLLHYRFVRKRLSPFRATLLSLLRFFTFASLIAFFLNPLSVEKRERKVLPSLAILLDTSPTMGLPEGEGKGSRLEEAKALLMEGSHPLLRSLSESYVVNLYRLGPSLMPLKGEELGPLKPGEKKGDLGEALGKLAGKVSLVLLLSDGNLSWKEGVSADLPVLCLPSGDPRTYKDILVKGVKSPHLAFRGREIGIDVTIGVYGYRWLTLPVVLKEGTKVIAAKEVRIEEGPSEVNLTLSFTPERVGPHHLTLSVPVQSDEAISFNNRIDFSLKVARDKIRVLMVSGSPSLNYRFMRMALKSDPSIDLLSFVILRTPSDILNVPLHEQSLIPFPVETLFSKELDHFDLLVFDNLPAHLYITPNYYGRIRDFVRNGGGFALIGGPHLLDGGRYAGTPLEEVLPLRLTGREDYRRTGTKKVQLTRAGRSHPVTQLSTDGKENESLWREMPGLDGFNLLEPKAFKDVLLEGGDGEPRPILIAGQYGRGRTLVLGTDFSWKWYMGMVAKGDGHWAYVKFVERMVRWLTKEESLGPGRIHLPERPAEVGQELELRIRMGEGNLSLPKEGPILSIFGPDGAKVTPRLKAGESTAESIATFVPSKEGVYRIKLESGDGVREEFLTVGRAKEDWEGRPDHERLKAISRATGGILLRDVDHLLKELEAMGRREERRLIEERRVHLWNSAFVLAILLGLLSLEWFLRRRWGLI